MNRYKKPSMTAIAFTPHAGLVEFEVDSVDDLERDEPWFDPVFVTELDKALAPNKTVYQMRVNKTFGQTGSIRFKHADAERLVEKLNNVNETPFYDYSGDSVLVKRMLDKLELMSVYIIAMPDYIKKHSYFHGIPELSKYSLLSFNHFRRYWVPFWVAEQHTLDLFRVACIFNSDDAAHYEYHFSSESNFLKMVQNVIKTQQG